MVGKTFTSRLNNLDKEKAMRIVSDVFPAIVALAPANSLVEISSLSPRGKGPEGTRKLDRCRVVLMNGQILIAIDSPSGPSLVFREAYVSMQSEGKIQRVKTETGKVVAFTKDENCGCGSRLRSWNPYGKIMSSSKDPQY